MRRDPRVGLDLIDPENPYRHLSIRGRVVDITEEGASAHIDKLAKKYPDQDKYDGVPGGYGSSIGFSQAAPTHGFRARPRRRSTHAKRQPSEGHFAELGQIEDPEHRHGPASLSP